MPTCGLKVIVEANDVLGGFNTGPRLTSISFGNAFSDAAVSDPTTYLMNVADEQSDRKTPLAVGDSTQQFIREMNTVFRPRIYAIPKE